LSAWLNELSELIQRGLLSEASQRLQQLCEETPADPDRWRALMEVAAARDDYQTSRMALAYCLSALKSMAAEPESLDPLWIVRDDIRLKIAQLWVSHDGRNLRSREFLYRALEHYPWYVRSPPTTETVDEVYLGCGDLLGAFESEHSVMRDELSLWRDWVQSSDVIGFRGEFCVSQAGSHDPSNFGPTRLLQAYTVAYEYALSHDRLSALSKFSDDGAYGGLRFEVDGRIVSSDTIDSCLQLNFIARNCGFAPADELAMVDIGAGWGRLVSRFLELFPRSFAYALDAVPFSSFCAHRYLKHRGCLDRAVVGSRAKLEGVQPGTFDIAVNVHSWSEAPLASIEAWLSRLDALRVPFLFFVPHGVPAYTMEQSGRPKLIVPAILAHGWQTVLDEPKYGTSLQRQQTGLYPSAHYYLFSKRFD
jgi:hypothetical protein